MTRLFEKIWNDRKDPDFILKRKIKDNRVKQQKIKRTDYGIE